MFVFISVFVKFWPGGGLPDNPLPINTKKKFQLFKNLLDTCLTFFSIVEKYMHLEILKRDAIFSVNRRKRNNL